MDLLKMAVDAMVENEGEGPRVTIGPRSLQAFADALKEAVIAELAVGVNVTPAIPKGYHEVDWELDGVPCDYFTLPQLQVERAAARVQALEEAAKRMHDWRLHPMEKRNLCDAEKAIRALIGGAT